MATVQKSCYAIVFWDLLMTCTDVNLADIGIDLSVDDFSSVRDLYNSVKRQLVAIDDYEGTQKISLDNYFGLMRQVDYIFEMCVTNNETTDRLFEMAFATIDLVELSQVQKIRVKNGQFRPDCGFTLV